MRTIAGMACTGRELPGPAADIIELESDNGLTHTGIVFHRQWAADPTLQSAIEVILPFLEQPDVCDVVELADYSSDEGAFIYPTGKAWTVAEILRHYADFGEPPGVKAGLELCYLVGRILHEASEIAPDSQVYSHGNLNPWNILVKGDGQVQVIGYGIPQVEIVAFRDHDVVPSEDSFRYCPPERIEGEHEDVTSDLFSLALVAFELMTGQPLYNGLLKEIRQQAISAQGPYRLYQWREALSESVIEFLSRALKPDPDSRHQDANEFVWEARDVMALPEIEGPSLAQVVDRVRNRRGKKAIMGGGTTAISKDKLAELRQMLDEPEERELPPPRGDRPGEVVDEANRPRWGRVARSGEPVSRGASRSRDPAPAPEASDERRPARAGRSADDLRARLRGSASGASSSTESSADRLRERLQRSKRPEEGPRRSRSPDPEPRRSREEPSRAGRSREEPEPADDPAPSPATSSQGKAEALLQRLMRSSSSRKPKAPRASEPVAAEAPAPTPELATPKAAAPAQAPSAAASSASSSAEDASTFQIEVPGSGTSSVRVAVDGTVAAFIQRLVGTHVPMPSDLSGRLTGWYRIEQGSTAFVGNDPATKLDSGAPVKLIRVPNQVVVMDVTVEDGDQPLRFRAPVGSAVPVGSILSHLRSWLGLKGEGWSLYVDSERVDPLEVLDDFEPKDGFAVVVKK